MHDLIIRAAQFAHECHKGQKRKYNGMPYITHPIRVAGRVATHRMATRELVAAAFLHDVVEDCGVAVPHLVLRFGQSVADYVEELTNTSGLLIPKPKRAERKRLDRERVATISIEAKVVKLIDHIDNLREIDPTDDFCQLYCRETLNLLEVLTGVDEELESELSEMANLLLH